MKSKSPTPTTPCHQRNPRFRRVIARVATERDRQRQLLATGKIPINPADPTTPNVMKLAVLSEEVGALTKALLELDFANTVAQHTSKLGIQPYTPQGKTHAQFLTEQLAKELTQATAVSVAWLESLDTIHPQHPNHL